MKPNTEHPDILNLIDQFCKLYGCSWDDLTTKSRTSWKVECRYMIWHYMKTKYHLTPSLIARLFGKDHTTILHGLRQMQHRIESDSNFSEYMVKMDSMLGITWDVKVENVE
jgi:chromosomal replication initiator protein